MVRGIPQHAPHFPAAVGAACLTSEIFSGLRKIIQVQYIIPVFLRLLMSIILMKIA